MALPPVVDELGAWIVGGRIDDPQRVITEAQECEAAGMRTVWISERYDVKEAGVLCGIVAATTDRVRIGAGLVAIHSRNPLMMAALASTMQAVSKDRFVLGLGRGADAYIDTAGRAISSLAGTADYATILRRMWAGEDFAYDGPAGSWSRLRQPDPYQGAQAELLLAAIGDKALAVGGRHYDSVMLHPIMTPAAVRRAVDIVRNAAADAGRDPASVRIYAPVLVAPELSEEETILRVHARAVTYLTVPAVGRLLTINNGWSLDDLTRLQNHEQFHALGDDDVPDLTFWRKDLLAPARSMPRHWMDETCAIGSIEGCIARLREFLTAGADELILHSALPHQLAPLVRKWREAKAEKVSA